MTATTSPMIPAEPTLTEKEGLYADAVIMAITTIAKTIGTPDKRAALVALAYTTGYLLGDMPAKDRLAVRKAFIDRVDSDAKTFSDIRALTATAGRA